MTWDRRAYGATGGFSEYGGPYIDVYPVPGGAGAGGHRLSWSTTPAIPAPATNRRCCCRTTARAPSRGRCARPGHAPGTGPDAGTACLPWPAPGIACAQTATPGRPGSRCPCRPWTRPLPAGQHASSTAAAPPRPISSRRRTALWYAPTAGQTWQALGSGDVTFLDITPYLPLTLLGMQRHRLQVLDLPDAGRSLTAGVAGQRQPRRRLFRGDRAQPVRCVPAILAGARRPGPAWLPAHRGVPRGQPADGQVYLVQYFERARFEYHPEISRARPTTWSWACWAAS